MRTNVDAALVTYLNAAALGSVGLQCAVIDLFTVTLVGVATPLRLASWDQDIVWGGQTFSSAWPYVNRSELRTAVGLEPSEMDLSIFAPPQAEIGTYTVLAAIAQGQFDGASVQVDRLYLDTTFTPIGAIYKWFLGQVANVSELDRVHAVLVCKDKLELLNTNVPRNLYGPGCRRTLGDGGCGVNLEGFTVTGVVQAGSNASVIQTNLNTTTYPGPLPTPAYAPTLSHIGAPTTGINLPSPVTYWATVTYVGAGGESLPGTESSLLITSSAYLLTATFPHSVAGATGWNLYVGTARGNEQLQNATPLGFGDTWTELGNGLVQGQPPPQTAVSGYFALGTITFTSGALLGISRFVSQYASDRSVSVLPPLPSAPAAGITFAATAGCDKSMAQCGSKFSNTATSGGFTYLKAYGGTPFLPPPEQSL